MAAQQIAVRFIKHSMPYSAGEIAWFNEVQAASYIKQKFAERVEPQPEYVPAARRDVLKETGAASMSRKEMAATVSDAVAKAIEPLKARLDAAEAALAALTKK
jgi:hypothetical protein